MMNVTEHLLRRKTESSDGLPFFRQEKNYFSGFVLMGTDPLFYDDRGAEGDMNDVLCQTSESGHTFGKGRRRAPDFNGAWVWARSFSLATAEGGMRGSSQPAGETGSVCGA